MDNREDLGALTGSRASTEPEDVSAASGFDPARYASALQWIVEQAQNGMGIAAGCASTHGDGGGGLEMLHSVLSDIELNAAIALDELALATEAQRAETSLGSVHEGAGLKGNAHE